MPTRRHAIAGLRTTLLAYVAANLTEIEAASPDTLAILKSHPELIYTVMMTTQQPPAKRHKTGI